MQINKSLISNQNSYVDNNPRYIVIHNTDNFNKTADAKAHARAQHDGNFTGMSAHYYVDDSSVYQTMPHSRGAWHVGVDYGGKLFGNVNNRNSIGIEMCVNVGYDYEKAFQNTAALTRQLMRELGIRTDHVVMHYDVCAKNCPSQIRAKKDWNRFQALIGAEASEVRGIVVSDSSIEEISKVVYGEAGVIHSYDALLGVAQCIYDMWKSGQFGQTVTEVMQRNYAAYGRQETTEEAYKAVHDIFCKEKRRFPEAQILQFRSFTKYSDGTGNIDRQKCADLLNQYEYLGKDARDNRWGHLYFGHKTNSVQQDCSQFLVQAGSFRSRENAEKLVKELKAAGFEAILKCVEYK